MRATKTQAPHRRASKNAKLLPQYNNSKFTKPCQYEFMFGGVNLLEKIKFLCKERGISLIELERSCGVTERTIYRWDTSIPSVDKVKRVADYFGVTVDELLSTDQTGETERGRE